ncbi:hypothetical protein ACIBCH_20745 [Amycolatopsis thailandensis]|uniref:hypothetical protein n=1 Tax=Amycolatopsis thailandensis TaxID=589330 RepID=UPI0037AD53F5
MTAATDVPSWHRRTPEPDREFRSHECKHYNGLHMCHGFYDTNGSACGYDTFTCLCACHNPPTVTSTTTGGSK